MLAKVKLLGHIRRWLLAGVIFLALLIVAANVETLAQEKGWDLWLSESWGPAMSMFAGLLDQGLFWASFWFVCVATAVTWFTYFLARDRSPNDVLREDITASNTWVPIREAFEQIANHLGFFETGEADQEQVYSEVAKVIRQAAKTDGIKLRGNEHTDGTLSQYPYTEPKKLVPENYWDVIEIDWRGVIINQLDTSHTSLDDTLIYEGYIKELPHYFNVDIWREDLNYHWPIKGAH